MKLWFHLVKSCFLCGSRLLKSWCVMKRGMLTAPEPGLLTSIIIVLCIASGTARVALGSTCRVPCGLRWITLITLAATGRCLPQSSELMQTDSLGMGNQQDLGSVLDFINKNKLTDNRPLRPPRVLTENTYLLGQANGQFAASQVAWVQPSGASA